MSKLGCEKCFGNEISSFESINDFENLDLIITQKSGNGILKLIKDYPNEHAFEPNYTIYECNYCNTKWWLSEPDHAWRGYFLKEQTAKVRMSYFILREKSNKKGCLIALIILVSLILYFLYK